MPDYHEKPQRFRDCGADTQPRDRAGTTVLCCGRCSGTRIASELIHHDTPMSTLRTTERTHSRTTTAVPVEVRAHV